MLTAFAHNASLTVALALALGLVAQVIARHVAIPGIVLLLAVGVGLGPDGAGLVQPASLGSGLHTIVGFAVSVILFEGGLSLSVRRLRREQRAIRQLVTLGAISSAGLGMLVARYVMGWSWTMALLFGSIVVVTGPKVINPLMKRLRVEHTVATVLEAEGILVDAIGAVCAAVALDIALSPGDAPLSRALSYIIERFAVGTITGASAGALIVLLLRRRRIIPKVWRTSPP